MELRKSCFMLLVIERVYIERFTYIIKEENYLESRINIFIPIHEDLHA